VSVVERGSAFSEQEAELLFEEARRRTRRRRRRRVSLSALGIGLAAVALAIVTTGARGGGSSLISETASHPFADLRDFSGHGDLAFVSRGRLWVLSGTDRRLRAVSPAGDQASAPQFSPNGRWLAFTVGASQLWVAHADGSGPHPIGAAGGAPWLPDGSLIAGGHIWRMSPRGAVRAGTAPPDLVGWAPDGSAYAFVARDRHRGANGSWSETQRLEVSRSLRGPRTTWFSNRISFTNAGGVNGGEFGSALPLPAGHGILFRLFPDNSASLAADGLPVYELQRPGAKPRDIGTSLGMSVSIGHGAFALTRGFNRYAWVTKSASLCSARCIALPTSPGKLSVEPALSASGGVAYVQAAIGSEGMIGAPQINSWYSTRRLWIIEPGAPAREVAGSAGAATPLWSADGRSLVYVSGDALWLLASPTAPPARVAAPLFFPGAWPSFYGEVPWQAQFAWSS
jgi:hypothetical protein